MHILFVSHEYHDSELPEAGGIGHFIFQFANELVKYGYQVSVIGYSDVSLSKMENGVGLYFFKSYISYFKGLYNIIERILHLAGLSSWLIPIMRIDRKILARKIKQFVEENSVDLVELNDYVGDGAYLDIDTPTVLRAHGSYTVLHNEVGFRENKAFRFFEKLQIQKSGKAVAVSNYSKDMLQKHFDIKDVQVIHNGLDLEGYLATDLPKVKSILYFGTLSEAKGMDRLVQIFNQLVLKDSEVKLKIAGKTKDYFEKKMLPAFSSEAKDRVQFLGYLDKTELVKVLDQSSLLLFPSRIENFSLALLETMASGRMAICWDIPSFRELIIDHQNGCLVANVDQAVEKIVRLLEDKDELLKISLLARKTIEQRFSWDKLVLENISFYNNCIRE